MLCLQVRAGTVPQAVAESSEPFIQRQGGFAIVALEIPVMEIVKIRTGRPLVFQNRPFKAVMTARRRERGVLNVEQEMAASEGTGSRSQCSLRKTRTLPTDDPSPE